MKSDKKKFDGAVCNFMFVCVTHRYAFESSFSMDSSSLYTQQDQSFSDEAQAFCSSQSYFPNYESGFIHKFTFLSPHDDYI